MHKEYEEILEKIAKQERKVIHRRKLENLPTYQACLKVTSHPGKLSQTVLKVLNEQYQELCESISLKDSFKIGLITGPNLCYLQSNIGKRVSDRALSTARSWLGL